MLFTSCEVAPYSAWRTLSVWPKASMSWSVSLERKPLPRVTHRRSSRPGRAMVPPSPAMDCLPILNSTCTVSAANAAPAQMTASSMTVANRILKLLFTWTNSFDMDEI